jgi:SAM-dependent methyltransferase
MPKLINSVLKTVQSKGIFGVLQLIQIFFLNKKITTIQNKELYLTYFAGKSGIEIGGPSDVFSTVLPIYQVVTSLDGCNFSSKTIWEGTIAEGKNFNYFENKKGYQYICEASNLIAIPDENYDFLVASHCLEHCANTLKTVKEWLRVVKKGGAILLLLPDKRVTFDHNRPTTTFEHLLDDLENDVDETDLTHLDEILELHDLNWDLVAGTKEQFKKRSLQNHENRCLHHHVFDFGLLRKIFKYNNIKVIDMSFEKFNHQIILGIKQ